MTIRKVVAGSVLATGIGAAGMFGAGTASAAPGISYDRGTSGKATIGIGDQSEDGAQARASEGNRALAISLFRPSKAVVEGDGTNNNAVAFDGETIIRPTKAGAPNDNNVFTAYGATTVEGPAKYNNIVNVGGRVEASGEAASQTSISLCGTSLSGQADHIKVGTVTTSDAVC